MGEPADLPEDTIVLGGEAPPPPPRRPRSRTGRWLALGLAVVLAAFVAWLNRPSEGEPGPIADDLMEPGSRTRPLYPGADGRLLFTVQEEPAPGELVGERLWTVQLETGAVDRGPLLAPVGTDSGLPAGPGVPPHRSFALGPPGSPSAGVLALLGDGPSAFGARRFAFFLDVGSRRLAPPLPVGEAVAFGWRGDGTLVTLRPDPGGGWTVEGIRSSASAVELGRIRHRSTPSGARVSAGGRRTLVVLTSVPYGGGDDRVLAVDGDRVRTALAGWRVLGVGPRGVFLVERPGTAGPLARWTDGGEPQALPGFEPDRILGWTADRLRYAAIGGFRGEYGLWLVQWPNMPVFLMRPLDPGGTETVDAVAFDGPGVAAFFVLDLELWMVEVGSERARRVPLPDDVARELPSGPVVWVP